MANNWDTPDELGVTTLSSPQFNDRSTSIAMAMGGAQFDFSTPRLQLSISGATYQGNDSLSIGGATKLSESLLFSGSAGTSGGEWAGVISATMRF